MKHSLVQQLKKRRLELGLKQNDMMLRMGISRQQYQRLVTLLLGVPLGCASLTLPGVATAKTGCGSKH